MLILSEYCYCKVIIQILDGRYTPLTLITLYQHERVLYTSVLWFSALNIQFIYDIILYHFFNSFE